MRVIADSSQVAERIEALAGDVAKAIAAAGPGERWALVGIRNRGDELARRIAQQLGEDRLVASGGSGVLDITLYRDDLSEIGAQAIVQTTDIPFNVDGIHIVLIDDVLMTGRSIRAAMQSLIDLGRPKRIWLGVLVDRGGRELPISPDFVGMDLSQQGLGDDEQVAVQVKPRDDRDAITVNSGGGSGGVSR